MGGRFEECIAYIYDADGNMLTASEIYAHDKTENSIEVLSSQILLDNQRCSLFILSSPTPYACSGIVHPNGQYVTIKLFSGAEKENRGNKRYNITGKALITTYICEEGRYGLHKPVEADLINISTTGVRFGTRYNMLSLNDRFAFHIKIRDNVKTLTAEVLNLRDIEDEHSEYGCVLIGKDNESVEL